VYGYFSGSIIGMRLPKLIRQVLGALLYKLLLDPIISHSVEACYERYLFDKRTAEHFARTHLPPEIQNGKGQQAFDIGCGRGRHVAILSQLGFTVTGMDLQKHLYWERIPKATFIVGSTECLSYIPDTTFDLVICMQVLMYLADDNGILAHIRRMLKSEGYFLIQVTNKENLHTILTKEPLAQDPYLQRYYEQSELCDKLKRHGFIIDRIWTEKFYTPFFVLPGNILYDFVLNDPLRASWDRLVHPRYLGLINILARAG
jgi:ubiquinone/menaquinone biosynthesis C-methylase UbiE